MDPASGAELPAGEVGEILVRSPAMMRGYWQDPELTATVVDADGWLHTGDLATIDGDGIVRIVGRLKEMYIRGGYNVYPAEVEAVLADHPAVAQVAVVGLPDPVLGELGGVFAVAADPAHPPELADLRELVPGAGSRTTRHPTGSSSSTRCRSPRCTRSTRRRSPPCVTQD